MKKFLSIGLIIFAIFFPVSVTQAVTHSTQADFNSALSVSVTALNETAGYPESINSGNYKSAVDWKRKCSSQSKLLDFWSDNLEGKESLECIMLADIIIMEREKTH